MAGLTNTMSATVLRDIVERKPASSTSIKPGFSGSSSSGFVDVPATTGFPKAHHRSQNLSAFAARRARANGEGERISGTVPTVRASLSKEGDGRVELKEVTSPNTPLDEGTETKGSKATAEITRTHQGLNGVERRPGRAPASAGKNNMASDKDVEWRRDMEIENDALIERMDDDQRERERAELVEQLGPEVLNLMSKIHGRRASAGKSPETGEASRPRSAMSHHSRTGTDESTPANKALRKLRFSDRPDEVFVYESQPSSPKRILALLPAPSSSSSEGNPAGNSKVETSNPGVVEDKTKDPSLRKDASDQKEDEHTADAIRHKYFPDEPPASENPTLAWLTPGQHSIDDTPRASESIRYDLQGRAIPRHLISTLPSHLGLHHHGNNPDEAGYTLDELLMLSRSTLPAQRAATLQVLAHLLTRIRRCSNEDPSQRIIAPEDDELKGEDAEEKATKEIFQKCLIVAIEAFGERASATVRMAGLDLIWAGLVHDANSGTGSKPAFADDQAQLDTLPLSYFYSAALYNFTRTTLNPTSSIKLFEVLTGLITTSTKVAEELVEVSGFLDGCVRSASSLESSNSPIEESNAPSTLTLLEFMKALVSVSRKCAQALIPGVSDSFLRYIVTLPSEDIPISPSSLGIVASILELYTLLGRYGLGASVASTGQEYFQRLARLVSQDLPFRTREHQALSIAWLELIETWIICAVNPHQTSPEHDILWSQVVAWQWSTALCSMRTRLLGVGSSDVSTIWSGWWRTWAAWLQGCCINEINQGEHELNRWCEETKESWEEGGRERELLNLASTVLQTPNLTEISRQNLLDAARNCHAASLLFEAHGSAVSPLTAMSPTIVENVTKDTNWRYICSISTPIELRTWTNVLANLARASRQVSVPVDLHYRVLNLLVPGDEMQASRLISDILGATLTPEHAGDLDLPDDFWTAAGGPAKILLPLYQYALWPQEDLFIAPLVPHSPALTMTTTLSRPTKSIGVATPSGGVIGIRLPQGNQGDWIISALDVLLRSGSTHSRLFRSLPADWTASESEVVRSLLVLMLRRRVPLSRSQLLFTCMKVFMLEHGQATLEGGEEVYQNPLVGRFMLKLLQPLRYSSSNEVNLESFISPDNPRLDIVAKSFLGPEQPFYQFYSDLLGLYDSSSFGHKLFGTLALPPTSQIYPRDYRKLLWGDYGHTLRSIQVEVLEIFSSSEELQHWLWPVEGRQDGEMLGFYVKALVRGHVTGFARFVAIHQVAGCLWPDMTGENERVSAFKLLRAVLTSTDESLLCEVLYYHQSQQGAEPTLPPLCYEPLPALVTSRLNWAVSTAGESVRNRFPSI